MTWNHAYTVAFAVGGSQHENWYEAMKEEKEQIISALLARVEMLRTNDAEFMEALEGFDTYDEDFPGFDGPTEDA